MYVHEYYSTLHKRNRKKREGNNIYNNMYMYIHTCTYIVHVIYITTFNHSSQHSQYLTNLYTEPQWLRNGNFLAASMAQ